MDISVTPLPHLSLLSLAGTDAETFLQGQACCDVTLCTWDTSITGALCNPQGRMYSSFRLAKNNDDSYLLRTHANIAQGTAEGLGKYIVFSKADIALASHYTAYGISGGDAASFLKQTFGQVPESISASTTVDTATLIQLDEKGSRYECWIKNTSPLMQALDGKNQGDPEHWKQENIVAGWGEIETETVDMFLPQMLNYQVTGQISFTKGCYTGQEVVARMHYRGKLKRRMYLASIETTKELNAGQPLYGGESEQSIGNLVNIASTTSGQYKVLAVITNIQAEAGEVYLQPNGGDQLIIGELPYTLEEVEK